MNLLNKISPLFLSLLLAICFTGTANAQANDKLEAEKIAFFTRQLSLTKAESEKFWPLYNDYTNRKDKINLDRRVLYQYASSNKDYLTEQEVEDAIKKIIQYQNQETSLIESFNKKFLEILPPKKVLLIYVTENQFNAHILKLIRDNRPVPKRGF